MHPIWKQSVETIIQLLRRYFRLQVEGLENLPSEGPCIITPNHSGYSGFDATILAHLLKEKTGAVPAVLTHRLWFSNHLTGEIMQSFGFIEATTKNGLKALQEKRMVVLFPEGEYGNFKPSTRSYRLQEFKRGFVRMALQTGSPIIPTLIIGAEETHINLRQLKLEGWLPKMVLPLPLNIFPLPAKWKIKFLPPMHLPYKAEAANDSELAHELAADLRERMQVAINKELQERGSPYW